MIDREHDLPISKQAEILSISRGSVYCRRVQCTPISRSCGVSTGCIWSSLRRFAMLRGLLAAGVQDRPSACEDADAADGDRGARSPSAHEQARARTQDLPVSAARDSDRAPDPGVGDGYHLHPDGARVRLFGGGARLVSRRALAWRLSITIDATFCS